MPMLQLVLWQKRYLDPSELWLPSEGSRRKLKGVCVCACVCWGSRVEAGVCE